MWLGRAAQAAMLWEPHFSENVNEYSPIEKFARRVLPICLHITYCICRQDTGPLKTAVKRLFTEFMNQLLEIGGNLVIDKRKIKEASKGMSDGWLV